MMKNIRTYDMINLLKLIKLHFNIKLDKNVISMLDEDLFLKPEDLAVYIYRLQNRIIEESGEKKNYLTLQALSYIQRIYTQMEIYYSAKIDKNFKIIHGIGTVVGGRVKIGNNVKIYQNVTIGDKGDSSGRPIIGDNVIIYAGVKILGDINIGDNVIIGANSVVLNSFEQNVMIAGVPAKIIKTMR